jgi:hypothetical protein
MNISEFKKTNKPKKVSALKKFETEILELYNANYSLKSITLFLENNGLKTTFQNVSRFIKNHKNNNVFAKKDDSSKSIEANKASNFLPKLEKIGKDSDLKDAPDWAN